MNKQLYFMSKRFRERGYKDNIIQKSREKTNNIERTDLLKKKVPKGEVKSEIIFSTIYNPLAGEISKFIKKKHWGILQCDTDLANSIQDQPKVVFKQVNNLHQKLVKNYCDTEKN